MSTSTYTVQGMTCEGCATKVAAAVSEVQRVFEADVDLDTGTVTVVGENVDSQEIRTAITEAGHAVA